MDRGHLSAVVSGSRRRLASGRSRLAGGGTGRVCFTAAADRQGDGSVGGAMATVARSGCAHLMELLPDRYREAGRARRRGRPGKNGQSEGARYCTTKKPRVC
jgi:hypothetical protein